MEVINETKRKGASRGNIHASARCLFSWVDTSKLRVRKRGSRLSTLAMSSSSANRTLLPLKSSVRLLTSLHLAAEAFTSESKSCTARGAGRSSMWRYRMRSAMGLRVLLTRSSGGSSFGQERKVSVWSMSSRGRFISVARLSMTTGHRRRCILGPI